MIARLLISPSLEKRIKEINQTLASHIGSGNVNHPDVLYFASDSKLGIEQARKIKEHFALKPYQTKGRVVILEDASNLTIDAQNALLKTLEELPAEALLILAAKSNANFLPTVLSRCQTVILEGFSVIPAKAGIYTNKDIDELLQSSIEQRFEYIEKLKDKKDFLFALIHYFHQQLGSHLSSGNTKFVKELLQAEQWAAQNVNIRAILEYLMLVMPQHK